MIIILKETLKKNLVNWNILVTKKKIKKDFVSSGERKWKKNKKGKWKMKVVHENEKE